MIKEIKLSSTYGWMVLSVKLRICISTIMRNGSKFKSRYRDEFEDKIELMDNILANKKEKVKVTWISIFKGK